MMPVRVSVGQHVWTSERMQNVCVHQVNQIIYLSQSLKFVFCQYLCQRATCVDGWKKAKCLCPPGNTAIICLSQITRVCVMPVRVSVGPHVLTYLSHLCLCDASMCVSGDTCVDISQSLVFV